MRREPTEDERRLLSALGAAASEGLPAGWLDGLLVESMSDGGMGSLRLIVRGVDAAGHFASELAECQFKDSDGIEVIATLYADKNGMPFELDVWKVDFSAVNCIPQELNAGPGDGDNGVGGFAGRRRSGVDP